VSGAIRSPTYTLAEIHDTALLTILHLDLYRLNDSHELENLGLREWARPGCVWLVEWPERGGHYLPPADLLVQLLSGPDSHELTVDTLSPRGRLWLQRLAG
jgi:tRNA threonylcarbamoyladenosine biosynthesis protein TsaE